MDGFIGISLFSTFVLIGLLLIKAYFGFETAVLLGISVILVSVFIIAYNSMANVKK